jgi:O-succinylbenzoic acid--CoA ligase
MNYNFPGLILNDKLFSIEDLKKFATDMVQRAIPEWERNIFVFILEFLNEKDYVLQKSSGTTGQPKLFKLSKKAMIESAKLTSEVLGLKFSQKALLCLSVDFIAGKMMIVRSLVAGLNLFWEEPSSMPSLARYGKIDFCSMVPLQVFNSFSNYEFFKNIGILLIGGSEIRSELKAMFREVANQTYETYGMAETSSHIALRLISGENPDKYFKTLPGITLDTDERSCLIIHAPFLDEPLKTNDVVELIDKEHFVWKARYDNLINTGGIKIKPEELEAEISKVLEIDFTVIGLPDDKLGQKIAVVIESETPVNEKELLEVLRETLEPHFVPKKIIYIKKLPRNAAYKIERNKLTEMFSKKE